MGTLITRGLGEDLAPLPDSTALRLIAVKERLALYRMAEVKVLKGQSYSIGNRSLERADLAAIKEGIKELQYEERRLESGNKIILQTVVPRDN